MQQALGGAVELDDAQVELAIGYLESDGAIVQAIGFIVGLGLVGLLHQVASLLEIVFLLLIELLDLLCNGEQVLGFLVVALVTMAPGAAALAEQILAFGERPAHVVADENHVRGVANLTARLVVSRGEKRPEPVFVVAVGFFNAGGGAAIALVAGRAAVFFGIVNFQKVGFRMAGEGPRIFIRLFAFQCHGSGGEFHRLANAHVAGLTAVDNIGTILSFEIGTVLVDIDLANFRRPGFHAVQQVHELRGRKVHHMIGEVGIHQLFFFADGLDQVSELGAQLGALVFQVVISFFELVVILKWPLLTVRHYNGDAFFLVFVQTPLLTLFCRRASLRLDVIG